MSNDPEFKISQDYELLSPKKRRAYPILIEEWEHLKERIRKIRDNANFYHTVGSVLLGVSGSAFVAAISIDIPLEDGQKIAVETVVTWLVFGSSLICGLLSLHFGRSQRYVQNTNTQDVIEHMELIERRYESEP